MKRLIISIAIILTVLFSTILVSGCRRENEPMVSMDKMWFAASFYFNARIVVDGEPVITSTGLEYRLEIVDRLHWNSQYFDPSYTEFVFVHNAEEAEGFADNVVVAWPSRLTYHFIPEIHLFANMDKDELAERRFETRDVITFEQFGLSYPLTIEDFVDNWESVHALWQSLTGSERNTILSDARRALDAERENEDG